MNPSQVAQKLILKSDKKQGDQSIIARPALLSTPGLINTGDA